MAAKKRPTRHQPPKSSSASRVPQPLPSDALVYREYDITDEPLDNRDIKKLPGQVQARLDELYELALHHPTQAIPELERLVTTYPPIPMGLDHGVGHPLLLLYDVKAPNGQNNNEFKGLCYYPSDVSLSTF